MYRFLLKSIPMLCAMVNPQPSGCVPELTNYLQITPPKNPRSLVPSIGHEDEGLTGVTRKEAIQHRRARRGWPDKRLLHERSILFEHLDASLFRSPTSTRPSWSIRTECAVSNCSGLASSGVHSNGTERCGTESSGRFPYAPQCRRYSPVAMSNTITRRLVLPKATRSGASFRTDPARRSFCVVWVRHQRVP